MTDDTDSWWRINRHVDYEVVENGNGVDWVTFIDHPDIEGRVIIAKGHRAYLQRTSGTWYKASPREGAEAAASRAMYDFMDIQDGG